MNSITTILPFVISGLICVGVWAGALGNRQVGWSICIVGHLSFMLYGVYAHRYGFLLVPPITATGLAYSIVKERRKDEIHMHRVPRHAARRMPRGHEMRLPT